MRGEQGEGEPVLTAQGLALDYPTSTGVLRALEGVDVRVDEGAFVTLVGPSGCGKSTLLRIMAGFVFPSQGTMTVRGEPIRGPHYSRGVVFQHANLYPWLNAQGNVEFGLRARGVPKAERQERARAMLELVGLEDARTRFPYELSGGMQQRVAIARVLANRPDILLMDEPFSALDEFTRRQLQTELKKIWQRSGQTVVFITHDVSEALYLSTSVFVIAPHSGRILERIEPPFATRDADKPASEVYRQTDFITMQQRILEHIEGAQVGLKH